MSELGDLLELLYGARRSWTTVTASVREWSHRDRVKDALKRQLREGRKETGLPPSRPTARGPDAPLPVEQERVIKVWVAALDRVHVEYQGTGVVAIQRRIASVNGRRVSAFEHNPIRNLLDPSGLVGIADLSVIGHGEVAGRPARIVEAVPRPLPPTQRRPFDNLAPGADRCILHVDDERGVLLRYEAQLAGDAFTVTEVTAITFDDVIPDELFQLPADEENPVRPEAVSLEEATRRAPFTVLVPSYVPPGSTLLVRLMPTIGARPFNVVLFYQTPGQLHRLQVIEWSDADGPTDEIPWVAEEHDGQRLWVLAPSPEWGMGQAQVKVVRNGTEVRILSATFGIDVVRAVALSLVPAPTEPPDSQ